MTDIHSHSHSRLRVQKHAYISGAALFNTFKSASIIFTDKKLSTGDLADDETHTHTQCLQLIACTNTHFSFTLPGAFPLRACSITCKLLLISSVWDESF